jgi:hypothetical protein
VNNAVTAVDRLERRGREYISIAQDRWIAHVEMWGAVETCGFTEKALPGTGIRRLELTHEKRVGISPGRITG